MKNQIKTNQGFGLLEIVIGSTIISVALIALVGAFSLAVKSSISNTSKVQATYLIEENIEAVKTLRDTSWSANIAPLTVGQDYFINWDSTKWATTTTPETIEIFSRSFKLDSVYRDGSNDIAQSGTLDVSTRKLTVTVSWLDRGNTIVKIGETYMTDLFAN